MLTKDTPYLALTGELWVVFCDNWGDNWLRYNGTALYVSNVLSLPATVHCFYDIDDKDTTRNVPCNQVDLLHKAHILKHRQLVYYATSVKHNFENSTAMVLDVCRTISHMHVSLSRWMYMW